MTEIVCKADEAAVLGIALCDENAWPAIVEAQISLESFMVPIHRDIFECMDTLNKRGQRIWLGAVEDTLRKEGKLDDLDDPYYLHTIVDHAFPAHLEAHLKQLKEYEDRRNGVLVCVQGKAAFEDMDFTPAQTKASIFKSLTKGERKAVSADEMYRRDVKFRQLAKQKGMVGLPSYMGRLNEIKGGFAIDEGEAVAIVAPTSHGKTTFIINHILHWAEKYDTPIAVAQIDQSTDLFYRTAVCCLAQVNMFRVYGMGIATPDEEAKVEEAWKRMLKLPIKVEDFRSDCSVMLSWFQMQRHKHGARVCVADTFDKIILTREEKRDRPAALADNSARLAEFGIKNECLMLLACQTNTREDNRHMTKAPPLLGTGAIKGSGGIENNVSGVITINKEPGEPLENYERSNPFWEMRFNVCKNKMFGPVGSCPSMLWTWRQKFIGKEEGEMERAEWEERERRRRRGF